MTNDTAESVRDLFMRILRSGVNDGQVTEEALAMLERYAVLLNECTPYLKEGESPAQRIRRDHEDSLVLMQQLVQEKELAELAYGWLWHVNSDDKRVHAARKVLLSGINLLGQAAGINRAKEGGARV